MARKKYTKAIETGARIKKARIALGLSMENLGKLLNPPSTKGGVSNWENGYNLPNSNRLEQLSKALKVSTTFLLDGKYTLEDLESLKKDEVVPMHEWFESMDNSQIESAINSTLNFVNNYKDYDKESIFAISKIFNLIDTLKDEEYSEIKQPTIDFVGVFLQNLNYMIKNDSEDKLKDFYQETINKTDYPK